MFKQFLNKQYLFVCMQYFFWNWLNEMAKFFSLPLILLAVSMSLPAYAGPTLIGGGSMRCEDYAAADETVKLATESWAMGFLSSANLRSKNIDLLHAINGVAVISALENFCATYPPYSIADASTAVLKELIVAAEGDCFATGLKNNGLNQCGSPASIESNDEPVGWSLTIPGVE
jgi:hypothetical protein